LECLVVDDSKSARFTLKRLLTTIGHEVVTADNGEHALEILCERIPDVIFMDHFMPGLDGFETAKKIRSQKSFARTPIIMCTAKDGQAYAAEAQRIGIYSTLPKPAGEEQIRAILERVAQEMASETSLLEQKPAPETSKPVTPAPQPTPATEQTKTASAVTNNTAQPPQPAPSLTSPAPDRQSAPTVSANQAVAKPAEFELNEQIRSLIRTEAEGRARDSAQRMLTDSWGRFRGNLQEDVRSLTKQLVDDHVHRSLDDLTDKVRATIAQGLASELRHQADQRLKKFESQQQLHHNDMVNKISGLKRQFELQKFDPVALHDTILEDAKRAAEYTATHKAVDTTKKIAQELCEQAVENLLDQTLLDNIEQQIVRLAEEIEVQNRKNRTLTIVATFASALATFSFAVAVWSQL